MKISSNQCAKWSWGSVGRGPWDKTSSYEDRRLKMVLSEPQARVAQIERVLRLHKALTSIFSIQKAKSNKAKW